MRNLSLALLLVALMCCPAFCLESIDALIPAPAKVEIVTGYTPSSGVLTTKLDASRADLGEEGYELVCDRKGFRLTATTNRGLHYGKLTLKQMKSLGSIPCCTITDKPAMKMRAVMFDLARCKEKHEYYYHVIDQIAQWKINTVFLHLTDDTGCALEIKSYPYLAGPHAFSQAEMRDLIKYAADRDIEIIPEIESWGHTGYLTSHAELKDISETGGGGDLCPSNPKTWEVLGNIYREVAALYPSRYIHAGCDEAAFGVCDTCKTKGEAALVSEHLRKVCEAVKANGKTPMIWGDVLLRVRPAADAVPKDTVICHWHYRVQVPVEPVEFLKGKGFTVIGCPAIVFGGRLIVPAADALSNTQSMTKVVLDTGCLGMETTVWIPQRYIADTLWFGLAYASDLSWSGERRDRMAFAKAFARAYYGFSATTEFAQALWNASAFAQRSGNIGNDLWNNRKDLEKLSEREAAQEVMRTRELVKAARNTLQRYAKHVVSHKAEYAALLLAADAAAHKADRAFGAYMLTYHIATARNDVKEAETKAARQELQNAIDLLKGLIKAEAELMPRLDAEWDKWRYADDPIKQGMGQNFIGYFRNADTYMKSIVPRLEDAKRKVAGGETVDWDGLTAEP